LYPLDLDRAFKSLDRIKQNVSVWWTTGAQPGQLLLDKEVQYANAWSGRLAVLWNDGVRHSFDQGLLDISFYVVPRGAPPAEKRAAMKFLHDWTDPAKQVTFAKLVFYTGNSPNLAPLLPQDKMFLFPTTPENKVKQVLQDSKWWYDNAATVEKRWQAWKLTASQ
jgi:putative spermidine/putrescine transport system substrate-binding protein